MNDIWLNADFWFGSAFGVVALTVVFSIAYLLDWIKTKATREAATSRSGRPIRSTPLYTGHRRVSSKEVR